MYKSPLAISAIALALVACSNEPPGGAVPPPASVDPAPPGVVIDPTTPNESPGEDCATPPIEPPVEQPLPESLPEGTEIPAPTPDTVDPTDTTAPPEDEWIDDCIPPDEFTDDLDDESDKLEPGIVRLTVSNQSFEEPLVHLVIKIDGDVVVDQEFDVGDQHNWQDFDVPPLEPGEHTITAEADTGASFEQTFILPDDEGRYVLLDYWGEFDFVEQDEPFQFA